MKLLNSCQKAKGTIKLGDARNLTFWSFGKLVMQKNFKTQLLKFNYWISSNLADAMRDANENIYFIRKPKL